MRVCADCRREIKEQMRFCSHCGVVLPASCAKTGDLLDNRYRIGQKLGASIFGEFFSGFDLRLQSNVTLQLSLIWRSAGRMLRKMSPIRFRKYKTRYSNYSGDDSRNIKKPSRTARRLFHERARSLLFQWYPGRRASDAQQPTAAYYPAYPADSPGTDSKPMGCASFPSLGLVVVIFVVIVAGILFLVVMLRALGLI